MRYIIRTVPLNSSDDNARLLAQSIFDAGKLNDETHIDMLAMYVWRHRDSLPGVEESIATYSNQPMFVFTDETMRKAASNIVEIFSY